MNQKKTKHLNLVICFSVLALALSAGAVEQLTLPQVLQYGLEHNLSLRQQKKELDKSKEEISANRAKLLPQISAFASLNDNFEPPVSMTDQSAMGKPYNITHTLQYSSAVGLQLNMQLFNWTVYTSQKIVRLTDEINNVGYQQARENFIIQVSKMYYIAQVTSRQIELAEEDLELLKELQGIASAVYENGMVLEVDLQRVNVNIENLSSQIDNARAMLKQQLNSIKFAIDYPAETEIEVESLEQELMDKNDRSGLSYNLYEFQLLDMKESIEKKKLNMVNAGYLPTLTLSGFFQYNAWTDKIGHWLDRDHESNKWYRSDGIGLMLRVPIFDGLERASKVNEGKFEIEKIQLQKTELKNNLENRYYNALIDLENSERNYSKQKNNYRLAESIYKNTMEQYKEGVGKMSDVLQDEIRMSEARTGYINAYLNYKLSSLEILRLEGKTNLILE